MQTVQRFTTETRPIVYRFVTRENKFSVAEEMTSKIVCATRIPWRRQRLCGSNKFLNSNIKYVFSLNKYLCCRTGSFRGGNKNQAHHLDTSWRCVENFSKKKKVFQKTHQVFSASRLKQKEFSPRGRRSATLWKTARKKANRNCQSRDQNVSKNDLRLQRMKQIDVQIGYKFKHFRLKTKWK